MTRNMLNEVMNRKTQTMSQSNTDVYRSGIISSGVIDFEFKFISMPEVTLTPWGSAGGATCSGISIDQDEDGFFVGATIEMGATTEFVVWTATGTGIDVPPEE